MDKILILNYEFPPLGGGGGRVSISLGKGFLEKGYEVDVITSMYDGLLRNENVEGINVHRVTILGRKRKQTASFLSMLTFLISGSLCGIRLCRKNNYAFINTHFVLPTGPLGFFLSKLFRIKNILSLLGGDIYDPSKKSSPHNSFYMRWVVKNLLNQADHIVALSSDIQKNAVHFYKPEKEITVIINSYEPFVFEAVPGASLGLKENKRYLISIGRVVPRKGFDYLIKCLALLDDDIELLIIGDGTEKEALTGLALEMGLTDRVHLLGEVSEEEKFQYLSNADIYVLSSLHEGLGIVLQEAMQVGLPIVSTNYGGQVDLVTNNVNGLLVEPENAVALAEAIRHLLEDIALYEKISCNNIEKVREFRPDIIIHEYLNLIEER